MNMELINKLMKLNSQIVISDFEQLVSAERKLKIEILHYLWVIQQKRIFAELSYSSLFEFCMKHIGYTEAESQRRISAMRLLGEIPEIESKITDGHLSLSSLAMAQSLFRQEAKSNHAFTKAQKIEVLKTLENKSVRQCEKEILKFSTTPIKAQEKIRPIGGDLAQISFSAPKDFVEKLEKLKAIRSHKNVRSKVGSSTLEIFSDLLDQAIRKEDPAREVRVERPSRRSVSVAREVIQEVATVQLPKDATKTQSVSAQTKRSVWRKCNSRCSYIDSKTGIRCQATHFLEIEHIKPRAKGGAHEEENLRLLCRAHNQLTAIQQFGFDQMDRFINPPS